MEKKPEWTWLKEISIDPEFGHFTKTADWFWNPWTKKMEDL